MGLFALQQKIEIGNKFEKFVGTNFSFLKLCLHLRDAKFLTGNVTTSNLIEFNSSLSKKDDPTR